MITRIDNTVIDAVMWHSVKRPIKALLPSERGHPVYDDIMGIYNLLFEPAKQLILRKMNEKRL